MPKTNLPVYLSFSEEWPLFQEKTPNSTIAIPMLPFHHLHHFLQHDTSVGFFAAPGGPNEVATISHPL